MKDYCYELCVVFSPKIEEQKDYHYNTVRDLLKEHNCQVLGEDDWGRRDFAFPMKKFTSGFYLFIIFKSDPNVPRIISDTLHMNELILREMIIKRVIGKDVILRDDNTVDTISSYASMGASQTEYFQDDSSDDDDDFSEDFDFEDSDD